MWRVHYTEDGVEKTSEPFGDMDEAFGFQSGLLVRRRRREDGSWNIDVHGVEKTSPSSGEEAAS